MSLHTVGPFDLREMSDAALAELHRFEVLMDAESGPDDPARPLDDYVGAVRSIPSFIDVTAFLVRDAAGAVAGEAECVLVRTDDNRHLAQVAVSVLPGSRGHGVGRSLLRGCADLVEQEGRSLVVGVTSDRVPAGAAFARRIGADPVNTSSSHRLMLADVDRALVAAWSDEGEVRAHGYVLRAVEGPLPQEMVEEVASLLDVMNDVPGGSPEVADRHTTAAHLREWEAQAEAAGRSRRWIFAAERATGTLVGLTEVTMRSDAARVITQGDTGVLTQHRGQGLGRSMKAAMIGWILEACPSAVEVRTNNADSNDAILAVNRRLGFVPHIAQTTWQVSLTALRRYLSG